MCVLIWLRNQKTMNARKLSFEIFEEVNGDSAFWEVHPIIQTFLYDE